MTARMLCVGVSFVTERRSPRTRIGVQFLAFEKDVSDSRNLRIASALITLWEEVVQKLQL